MDELHGLAILIELNVKTPVMNLMLAIMKNSLYPVLKVFAKIFVTVTGTIEYVVTVLQHWVAVICSSL